MTTIIRRYRRGRLAARVGLAPLVIAITAAILLMVLAGWVTMIIWIRGGPQPVHEIVIALPTPKMALPGPKVVPAAGPVA